MPEPSPWPASAVFGPEGLAIGGVRATDLAAAFGTPLVVYDVADVRGRMRAASAAFPRAAYAVKAFTGHALLRMAVDEGLDLLCASGGEVAACVAAGIPADRILLHGNAKTDRELREAVDTGVGLVIADDVPEIERLDAIARAVGRVQDVLLRVRPGVEAPTHEKIATGHEESKFGVGRDEAPDAIAWCREFAGVRLVGLQAHAGSQVLEPSTAEAVLDVLVGVAREADLVPDTLDVGGGFGVTYDDESPLDIRALGRDLVERLEASSARAGWPTPLLRAEPGRTVVANPACTLAAVVARKRAGAATLVAVDAGMSDNPRPILYDARHRVAPASTASGGDRETVTVVGRHCESGDVIARDVDLPAGIGPGDLLAVAATGAYTYTLASVYNRFGRPAVLGVEDGEARLWLRREDPADMDRLEVPRVGGDRAGPVPPGVEVRPATPGDARSYLAHWTVVVEEGRFIRSERVTVSAAHVRRRFRASWGPAEANILAIEEGEVVGHIGLSREAQPATRHVATLGMAVSPGHRRRGIGAALLAEGFRWGAEQGIRKLVLSVYPDNPAAIALYRRFGFAEEGRLAGQSQGAEGLRDEILMAAWIDGRETR
jgi:diaminopimelate decarboxylase